MIFYDFEVFAHDWLVVVQNEEGKEGRIHNNAPMLRRFFKKHAGEVWTGYNAKYYDQFILRGILCGKEPKEINDAIIKRGASGWSVCTPKMKSVPLITYDVKGDSGESLKQLEGHSGRRIHETDVPFDLDRPLTDEEVEATFCYCADDVTMTREIFNARRAEYEASCYFLERFDLSPVYNMSKTKAQLAAMILGGTGVGCFYDDEFNFPILPCIEIQSYEGKAVLEWFRSPESHYQNRLNTRGKSVRDKRTYKTTVAGCEAVFAWGGLHIARKGYTAKGIFINIDVSSFYPSLIKAYKFGFRVMAKPENFLFVHDSNLDFKARGDKKARQPFKIMDNAIYGQFKQQQSKLYDPCAANAISVNGQLLLLDLLEHLEPLCDVVQANTDGILLKVPSADSVPAILEKIEQWESKSLMTMEKEVMQEAEIYQKDVNNYLLIDRITGKTKGKGATMKPLNELDNNLPIINRAVKAYFIDGVPVEDTINAADKLIDFQSIAKLQGAKYPYFFWGVPVKSESGKKTIRVDDVGKIEGRCIRFFASTDTGAAGLYKWNLECRRKDKNNPDAGYYEGPNKVANSPAHVFLDCGDVRGKSVPDCLDRSWYITVSKKLIEAFTTPPEIIKQRNKSDKDRFNGIDFTLSDSGDEE